MKIVTIVGARPQFIKAAPLSRILKLKPGIQEILVHTGQHYDDNMSRIFFDELEIEPPRYDLGVGSGSHAVQTGRMLEAIEAVLINERPDRVLVFGDTNSTLAGGLAAAKVDIPVSHVEAGLRSFNRAMPEEINRILVDHLADQCFAPTQAAVANLYKEGIGPDRVYQVGDIMFDAALYFGAKAERESRIIGDLGLRPKLYVLVTIHRAASTDDPVRLRAIFEGLAGLEAKWDVVVPLHPRTRKALGREALLESIEKRIRLIEPVGYLDMVMLERNAKLIVTDSGGVQKEAFFHQVPCRTLRDETEWVELLELGWNELLPPTDAQAVTSGLLQALSDEELPPIGSHQPYGTGNTAELIAEVLVGADRG